MKKNILTTLVFVFAIYGNSIAQTLQTNLPSANGTINAIRPVGSTIYLGGSFTYLGKPYGHAVMSNTGTSTVNTSFPVVGLSSFEEVKAIAADGSGGYYVVGSFTEIAGVTRQYIARINSNGTLNAWNPGANCNGNINCVVVSADFNTVYVGGIFTTIGQTSSSARNRIAALSASTGDATSWDPNSSGNVNCLALSASSTIYAGGSFTTIGGQTRNRIAEINTGSNTATAWDPNSNGDVNALLVSGSNVYTGGSFTTIGGNTRNYIARIPNSSSTSDSWNPNSDNTIYSLAISGNNVFAGGSFSSIGGVTTRSLAALDANTNSSMGNASWLANIDVITGTPDVRSIIIDGTTLYAAGTFNSCGGSTKFNVASVDITSLSSFSLGSFATTTGSKANAICISGSNIYIGGAFTISDGSPRNYIASINGTTGAINSWNPNANNEVKDILISNNGNDAYVSGTFTSIGGQSRNRLAKLSTSTGNADATWNPNANDGVEKMAMNSTETTLFFYGFFTTINGGTSRPAAAAVSTTGAGTATAFTFTGLPDITTRLISVAPGDSIVYFGYNSTGININSTSRNYFCAVRASDGSLTNWHPNFNQAPFCVVYVADTMYIGGQFTSVGGDLSYQRLAKFDGSGGWHEPVQDFNWNFSSTSRPSGDVRAIIYTNSGTSPLLYIAGSFFSIGVTSRQTYAAIKATDMTLMPWTIACDNAGTLNTRMALSTTNQKIYIGDNSNTSFNGTTAYKFLGVSGDASDPLPIKLIKFEGAIKNKKVKLNWLTAYEHQNHHFDVERYDENDKLFVKIGEVAGHLNSNEINSYQYIDERANLNSINYYRLNQIDVDGKNEYSNTISINANELGESISIYPNPSKGTFYIQNNSQASQSIITVYDSMGKKIMEKEIQNSTDEINLPMGMYYVTIISGNKISTKKLSVQK